MISSVFIFTNVHGINQQYKLKPKIMVDGSFYVIRFLYKLEVSGARLEPHFRLQSHSNL